MDENNIQILREDLIEEFQALAQTHTTTIEHLLEVFNDDLMLLRLDVKAYEREHLLAEKEEEATTQTSTANVIKEAAPASKIEEEPRLEVETEQMDRPITEPLLEATIPESTKETQEQPLNMPAELHANKLTKEEPPPTSTQPHLEGILAILEKEWS